MKKILALAILTAVSVTIYVGCKKGPDDPFISFKSRETRMVGTWNCSSFTIDGIDSTSRTSGYTIPSVLTCGSATVTFTYKKGQILTLGSDGNWNWEYNLTVDSSITFQKPGANILCANVSGTAVSDSVTTVQKGVWEFGGGIGQYKNKELLELLESTDEVTGDNFEIVECSSKELQLQQSITVDSVYALTNPYGVYLTPGPHVFAWVFKH